MSPIAKTLAPVALLLALEPAAVVANERPLEEVVVSAARRDASTETLSAAIAVIDAEAIQGQKLLTDALADNPGVYLQQTTPGQGAAIVRGLRGSSVLHLVDGMRFNNAIFRSAPTQYFALVPTSAVERVEVIRGTPASLYGSDAVGGVVQLVTRVPSADTVSTSVGGEVFAGWDSAELGRMLRGTLDVGNRRIAATASLEYLDTGDRKIGGGERIGPSAYESKAARFAVAWTPDDRRRWFIDLHYLEQPSTPRVDELVPGFGLAEPSSSEFFFEPNTRSFVHARYDHAAGLAGLDWRFDLGWQRIDDDRRTRNLNADERRLESNRSDLLGVLVTAARQGETRSWVAGIEAYHDRVASSRSAVDIVSGATRPLASRFPDGATLDQAAVFVNADRSLAARHAISGGLRVSTVRVDLPATAVSQAANVDTTDLSADVGWRFDVTERWQIVANAGYGFRAPNVFDLGTLGNRPGNRFNIPNTSLDSERVVQVDAGARRHGDRWQLEFVAYALNYTDRISSVSTTLTTPDGRDIVQSVNVAESRIHGAEVGLGIATWETIDLEAVLNYTWGEQDVAGNTEAADRIPPLGGRLNVSYDAGGALQASAWLRFAALQDRLSARDISDVRIDPNGTSGWGIAGAAATWRMASGWLLGIGVDNVFDKRYRNHGSGIDAPGRNLSLSIRRTW